MHILVNELRYARLPQKFVRDFQPYEHQQKTLDCVRRALVEKRALCIENTSATGSGKTLANFAAAILDNCRTCGVYPTNELIEDQAVSLTGLFPTQDMYIVDSRGLDDIQNHIGHKSHAQALDWATGERAYKALLTNPDVLYLALTNLYGQMYSSFHTPQGSMAFQNFLNNYPVIVFDEFHLYTPKQIASSALLIGLAQQLVPDKPHIFIFSSATPQPLFKQYIERLGIEICSVGSQAIPDGQVVCEPLHIHLLPGELLRWKGGEVIRDHLDSILSWADQNNQARGVFIVDSVYEARMIAESLRERYDETKVGEVHGFMDKEARAGKLLCRFSVGTTTIDVGVDLVKEKMKEFLVCEARSAAQAIQRVGRLGRHGREPASIPIANTVWLVVPEYVYAYMQNRLTPTSEQVGPISLARSDFNTLLNQAYLSHEDFAAYTRKYSPFEAVAATERILRQQFSDVKPIVKEKLHRLVTTLYRPEPAATLEEVEHQYKRYLKCQYAIWHKFGTPIGKTERYYLSDLESFRGGMESEFVVAIYDERDRELGMKPLKYYNLLFTLGRTEHKEMSKDEFIDHIKRKHPQEAEQWLEELARQRNILGYLHVTGIVQGKARKIGFKLSERTLDTVYQRVTRLSGLALYGEELRLLRKGGIQQELSKRELNCWIYDRSPLALGHAKSFPPLFTLYSLRSEAMNGNVSQQEWSIAFGLNAFLLESIFTRSWWVRKRSSGGAIFC